MSNQCSICLEKLISDLNACPCGHVFHAICILNALERDKKCPTCRKRVTQNRLIHLYFDNSPFVCTQSNNTIQTSCIQSNDNENMDNQLDINEYIKIKEKLNTVEKKLIFVLSNLDMEKQKNDIKNNELISKDIEIKEIIQKNNKYIKKISEIKENYNKLSFQYDILKTEHHKINDKYKKCQNEKLILSFIENNNNNNDTDIKKLYEHINNPKEIITILQSTCNYRQKMIENLIQDKKKLQNKIQELDIIIKKKTNLSSTSNYTILNIDKSKNSTSKYFITKRKNELNINTSNKINNKTQSTNIHNENKENEINHTNSLKRLLCSSKNEFNKDHTIENKQNPSNVIPPLKNINNSNTIEKRSGLMGPPIFGKFSIFNKSFENKKRKVNMPENPSLLTRTGYNTLGKLETIHLPFNK